MATVLEHAERIVGGDKACDWPALSSVAKEVVRETRKAVADARQAAKTAGEQLELAARRRPLASAGVAAAAGFVAGGVVAFALGWFAARRVGA